MIWGVLSGVGLLGVGFVLGVYAVWSYGVRLMHEQEEREARRRVAAFHQDEPLDIKDPL